MLFTALVVCLYGVCVFLWTFLSYLRIFHSFRQVTITCECWPTNVDLYSAIMAIEQWGFFNVHTYCDTGQVFIMVISENPWHSHLFRMFGSEAVTTCFKDEGRSRPPIEHRSPACKAHVLPLRNAAVIYLYNLWWTNL